LHASLIQRSAGGQAIARSDQWSDNWYVDNTNLQVFFCPFFPNLVDVANLVIIHKKI
jgi:hypothetical protein